MVSDINGISRGIAPATGQARNDRGGPAPESASGATAETVSLTPEAAQLKAAETLIADVPQVDLERVAALREAIASGSHTIDSRLIAERLLGMEAALDGRS